VFVLDISTDVGDTAVPVLGYFEIPDYPSCINDLQTCGLYGRSPGWYQEPLSELRRIVHVPSA
jgi:hypothetical protein